MNQLRLVVLDDEVDLAKMVCTVAEGCGYLSQAFYHSSTFIDEYLHNADVIVLDLMMPEIDGIEIIRYLAEKKTTAHLILMSGFDSGVLHSAKNLAIERKLNFAASLTKPFRMGELKWCLSKLNSTNLAPKSAPKLNPLTAYDLELAFKKDELVVYYQPKVGLNSNATCAVEALVRWQHPERGLIPPDSFIPLAEKNGLIDKLTWTVLKKAAVQYNEWKNQGHIIKIAINMSASTLKELDLPEKIYKFISEYDIPPSHIILEITESELSDELIKSLDILTRLRLKGFELSIDDFGTGYSSLVQLYRAPFTEIKVDRSFVSQMETDKEAATIVETIILMGQKLNMRTVAEGVETESCKKRLTELNCDQAQGYLFSKPMQSDKVVDWYISTKKD